MGSALYKKIELVANVAIILVAIMIAAALAQKYFFAKPPQPPPAVAIGSKLQLPAIDWSKNGKTLVFALQTSCHFCSESAPFYQRLVQAAGAKDVKLVAVLPQPPNEGHDYLNKLAVPISDVRQARLSSISVSGTPTLILVNEKGEVAGVWVGKLRSDKEAEVLARL
jgi:hypothetical protein